MNKNDSPFYFLLFWSMTYGFHPYQSLLCLSLPVRERSPSSLQAPVKSPRTIFCVFPFTTINTFFGLKIIWFLGLQHPACQSLNLPGCWRVHRLLWMVCFELDSLFLWNLTLKLPASCAARLHSSCGQLKVPEFLLDWFWNKGSLHNGDIQNTEPPLWREHQPIRTNAIRCFGVKFQICFYWASW